jgi:hypothetical protein
MIKTKDVYKRGDQTVVLNPNNMLYQVQTWTGNNWYGFVQVTPGLVGLEKRRQLTHLAL